ncbi:hypothetical protein Tco_0084313 [Tanacetum coccineum]
MGPVALNLSFLTESVMSTIPSMFSNLKKCLSDESLVIPMKELWLDDKLNFVEEPVDYGSRSQETEIKSRHKQVLKTENLGKRIAFLEDEHSKSFAKWLRKEVERELAISKESVSETVRWISYGPRATVVKYDAYNINGTDKEDTIVHTGQDPIHKCHSPISKAKYVPVSQKHNLNVKSPTPIKGCVLGLLNVDTWDDILKNFRMRTPGRCVDKWMNDSSDDSKVAKKPILKVIFKSHTPIKGCVLGLANVETWDNIMKKFGMRTPGRCADKSKGKRKI